MPFFNYLPLAFAHLPTKRNTESWFLYIRKFHLFPKEISSGKGVESKALFYSRTEFGEQYFSQGSFPFRPYLGLFSFPTAFLWSAKPYKLSLTKNTKTTQSLLLNFSRATGSVNATVLTLYAQVAASYNFLQLLCRERIQISF